MSDNRITNALTIDFEDWYQGLEIPHSDWDKFEDRIRLNGERILRILDEENTKATFFILGYVAEKHPDLIKEIDARGHEIATHGFSHEFIYQQNPDVFRAELKRAVDFLQDTTGKKVLGHRAPFFSITEESLWAFEVLAELGIEYDSSIFPTLNYRYGINNWTRFPHRIKNGKWAINEFPISTFQLPKIKLPISGGAYFRIYPYQMTKHCLKSINRTNQPFTFYLHPWELDVEQPRINLPRRISLTHYFNLSATEKRFRKLLKDFKFAPMKEVLEKLNLK